ncbi:MAG: hypothetical protein ABI119_09620 [Gemmatimonadaceae bacterium]
MRSVRFAARVMLIAVACAIGTLWLGWLSVVGVGFVYGLVESRVSARGSIAALGAAVAWVGLVGADLARGADIRLVAAQIGAVMHVPAVLLVVATLLFGAILTGTAAVLGAAIGAALTGTGTARHARAPSN